MSTDMVKVPIDTLVEAFKNFIRVLVADNEPGGLIAFTRVPDGRFEVDFKRASEIAEYRQAVEFQSKLN